MTKNDNLEAFSAKEDQKFIHWFARFEIHLKREKLVDEVDKIDELLLYLAGKPSDWFHERKALGSLPNSLSDIKDLLNEKWGTGIERVCRMTNGDLPAYIEQFEEIIRVLPAVQEKKMKLFKDGLDAKYYPLAEATSYPTYQGLKNFVENCYARVREETPEPVSVFRAREGPKPALREDQRHGPDPAPRSRGVDVSTPRLLVAR